MPRSRLLTILIGFFMAALCVAADDKPVLRALHIGGAAEAKAIWVVPVFEHKGQAYARVFQRGEGDTEWAFIGGVPGKPVQLTRYGSDLVLLMADGTWQIFGHSSGRPLPAGASILALAGDQTRLYALGQPPEPETRPATTQSTTQPSTRPVVFRAGVPVTLYQLDHGAWKDISKLDTPLTTRSAALALLAGEPVVADTDGAQTRLARFGQGKWQSLGSHKADGRLASLIGDGGSILAYVDGSPAPSALLVRAGDWLAPVPLAADSSIRALGVAGGQVRFIYADKDQEIKERLLNPRTFAVESPDTVLQLRDPVNVSQIRDWVHWGMMILISLVMLHTYRKREEYQRVTIDWNKVQLAPIGRRCFAGIIDLTPVLVALLFARVRLGIEVTDIFSSHVALLYYFLPGVAVFLLHTTIVEAFAGRSIGKIITRMHVIGLDGKRPTVAAMAIRNLLRLVDLVLWFTVILMLYLPLRQRMGDLAAGTVVVIDRQEDLAGPDA